ncbi:MAG: RNA polymerase sigma factor [Prevotella sp.]|nr:RNA polymerase sigma factor [Prevotella sp.]
MGRDMQEGFRMLVARYKQPLYWHIRRMVVSHSDAEDALQEAFIRIFRAFDRKGEVSSLRAWIFRIATNEALRLIEKRRENSIPIEKVFDTKADSYIDYSDLEAIKLQKAILALPPKQQLVFNLRYYDEMDYDEIALIAETTPTSAKASYYVAKEKIVKELKGS